VPRGKDLEVGEDGVDGGGGPPGDALLQIVDEGEPAGIVTVPTPVFALQTAARRRERTLFPIKPWPVPDDEPEETLEASAELDRDARTLATFPKDLRDAFSDAELLALKRSFDIVDADQSGKIDEQELHAALSAAASAVARPPAAGASAAGAATAHRIPHEQVQELMRQFADDEAGSAEMSLVQYARMVRHVRDTGGGKTKDDDDDDGRGSGSGAVALQALRALIPGGNEVTGSALARLKNRERALVTANARLEARRVFLAADTDGSGTLEPAEIGTALRSMGLPEPPPSEARLLALDLATANRLRLLSLEGGGKKKDADSLLLERDSRDPTYVPHVGLEPWLEYFAAARTEQHATSLLGRAMALLHYRPPPRVTPRHIMRFLRSVDSEAQKASVQLGEPLQHPLGRHRRSTDHSPDRAVAGRARQPAHRRGRRPSPIPPRGSHRHRTERPRCRRRGAGRRHGA
jgi:Ca2+-binding EF-hand superfamily protein